MPKHKITYSDKSQITKAMEELYNSLPDSGCIEIEIKDIKNTNNLACLWEEMGSSTGGLIGRFIGSSSEVASLALEGTLLQTWRLLGNTNSNANVRSDQEPGAGQEQQPDPR